ncbi:MAG: SDR family NAD(P)-dependent oxidoreductase, partial [Gemmatimonadetes bacterium]|nr:SDR family NAD(P)-dependent oxidoreductase [Gemmatimonadota bacterium]
MEHLSGLVDFSGKVVLVTGASRGIGRAIALVFARAGAKVALAARSADKLEEVAGEVCAVGGEALVLSV